MRTTALVLSLAVAAAALPVATAGAVALVDGDLTVRWLARTVATTLAVALLGAPLVAVATASGSRLQLVEGQTGRAPPPATGSRDRARRLAACAGRDDQECTCD